MIDLTCAGAPHHFVGRNLPARLRVHEPSRDALGCITQYKVDAPLPADPLKDSRHLTVVRRASAILASMPSTLQSLNPSTPQPPTINPKLNPNPKDQNLQPQALNSKRHLSVVSRHQHLAPCHQADFDQSGRPPTGLELLDQPRVHRQGKLDPPRAPAHDNKPHRRL